MVDNKSRNSRPLPPQSYLRECLSYCPENGKLYWLPRPRAHFNSDHGESVSNGSYAGQAAGTEAGQGYITIGINGVRYKAHRIVWKYWYGTEPDCIDHINHDRADNRIENLRDVSHKENLQNRRPLPTMAVNDATQSGIRGINYDKHAGKWLVRIWRDGRHVHIGRFMELSDAIKALEGVKRDAC